MTPSPAWPAELAQRVTAMWVAGTWTSEAIALQIGRTRNAVCGFLYRAGLMRKRGAPQRHGAKWTPERVETMRRMLAQGLACAEVGEALGMTAAAVNSKAIRLKITERNHDPGRHRTQKTRAPDRPLPRAAANSSAGVRLVDIANGQCRWPLWAAEGWPDFYCCGKPCRIKDAYCAAHAARAFGGGTRSERAALSVGTEAACG